MRGVHASVALLIVGVIGACGDDAASPSTNNDGAADAGANVDGDADANAPVAAAADWVIAIDPSAPAAGKVSPALLGQYDLSGSLFHYDKVPNVDLVSPMKAIGLSEWRVGVGRWEITTQLLPTLTDGTPCPLGALPPEARSTLEELPLIASRDWFVDDDGAPVSLAATQDDARYQLTYLRSVIEVAAAFGAGSFVNIDHMPRAFAANRTPSRTTAVESNACTFSWTNRVSNAAPADAYLASTPGVPPIFASAVVGLVKRIVEGSSGNAALPVKYWELWNEPDLAYAWDRSLDDKNLTKFFTMAAQVMLLLDAYRKAPSSPKDLKFGMASFANAKIAADILTALDTAPERIPVDFFSFHSYSNDPLVIVDHIKQVVAARAASQGYKNAELALTEWGPDLASPPNPGTMETPLLLSTALVLGATLGLDRAHHSILWDFYQPIPFGIIDHAGKPKPAYHAYGLLSRAIAGGSERLAVTSADQGQLTPGGGAVLATRDTTGKKRVLIVNREQASRTVRVDLSGTPTVPTSVVTYHDPNSNGPTTTAAASSPVLTLAARSITLLEL